MEVLAYSLDASHVKLLQLLGVWLVIELSRHLRLPVLGNSRIVKSHVVMVSPWGVRAVRPRVSVPNLFRAGGRTDSRRSIEMTTKILSS